MGHRIRAGGLGGLPDETKWEKQMEEAQSMADFVSFIKIIKPSLRTYCLGFAYKQFHPPSLLRPIRLKLNFH